MVADVLTGCYERPVPELVSTRCCCRLPGCAVCSRAAAVGWPCFCCMAAFAAWFACYITEIMPPTSLRRWWLIFSGCFSRVLLADGPFAFLFILTLFFPPAIAL